MANKNEEFLKKLLATFKIEAEEHLHAMSAGLLELEQMPTEAQQAAIVERIFREAHSLKGASRAVNLTQVESVCQSLESVFSALKGNRLAVTQPLIDLMQEALDDLATLLSAEGAAMADAAKSTIETLTARIDDALSGTIPARAAETAQAAEDRPQSAAVQPSRSSDPTIAPAPPIPPVSSEPVAASAVRPAPQPGSASETVRVSIARLAKVMRQAEELLPEKLSSGQRAAELREIGITLASRKKKRAAIQPLLRAVERAQQKSNVRNGSGNKQRELSALLDYLDAENLLIKTLESRIAGMRESAEHDHRALSGIVDGLLQDVREMLMLPLSSLLEIFPHFVRELARDQGKEIELTIRGGNLEIDRRILEEIKDPFIHLLRNCVDHGIEKPDARREKQKSPTGALTISIAQQDGDKVEIVVSDDGAGIDIEKLKSAALRLGLVSPEVGSHLGEREALALAFQSGVSTSPIITDISGRGLGLAIVREKIERLGGTVEIETHSGVGTTFRFLLPLTLATFRGVLVRAGEQLFVLPLHNVERVLRLDSTDIRTVENRETIPCNEQAVALARLSDVLELDSGGGADDTDGKIQAAILGLGTDRIAFQVDEVLGEQEVLVKMLGRQLARVRNVAGACVLGTGQVVPVLNVPDLMKSAMRQSSVRHAPATEKAAEMPQRSILVAEDSITSRALLKNILESAGYRVVTAVDGMDGYTALKSGNFDLLVSDVEMPRMSGFDLTAKVREDKRLGALPVVLVTALDSREDRERGIDVGANAYIVKSSFDQSNLLDVIRQLI